MTIRDDLHALVDALPEEELDTAQRVLVSLSGYHNDALERLLMEAPYDDEPTTPEEDRLAEEAWHEYLRGESISDEEVRRQLLG